MGPPQRGNKDKGDHKVKNTIKFGVLNLSSGSVVGMFVPWSGGRGWLNVAGTFTGATASLNLSLNTNVDAGPGGVISIPVPGVPLVNAAGIYPFEAPKGAIAISVQATGGGDSIALTELSIIDVNVLD